MHEARLAAMYHNAIRTLLNHAILGRATRVGLRKPEYNFRVVFAPVRTGHFMRAIVGTSGEIFHGAIVCKLEIFLRASRRRDQFVGTVINRAAFGVIAINMHPPLAGECLRFIYHIDLLGPSNVARIRATCCAVNMNMESSST